MTSQDAVWQLLFEDNPVWRFYSKMLRRKQLAKSLHQAIIVKLEKEWAISCLEKSVPPCFANITD